MGRREQIADAALETLAEEGMRGLTHRAVDRRAGLSEGSTSYYHRSRSALLDAAVQRLVDLDGEEIPALPVTDVDSLVDGAAVLFFRWMTVDRVRQLARYELMLESTRRPDLQATLRRGSAQIADMAADVLRTAGVNDAELRARQLISMIDGVLFDHVVSARRDQPITRAELRDLVRRATSAVID